MGLSGKVPAEAETLFAKARILWKNTQPSSLAQAMTSTDPEQAVELLDQAVAIAPGYAEAYLRRGLARSELGQGEEGFEDLTRSVRLASYPDTYACRALVSLRSNNLRGANKDLEYALDLDSSRPLAWNISGLAALAEDNPTAACERFARGCSRGDCTYLETARVQGLCE